MQGKKNCQLVEVFKTEQGIVYQCNRQNMFCLEFSGVSSFFKITDFLDFIKKVNKIDIEAMASSTSPGSDIAILMPHYTERCFVLTMTDVLKLRELLSGAKFMLQLNSMIFQCLSNPVS
ncbi:hypothetical protein [Pedobacter sp. SYSU D00535]|uniref:hypothetical protein n=1 Tax=Pedobacter sp. SYSU D00535 TaxID=2810308 RepID=UPI001A97BFA6|nr:hypothetical protein [Pedobacter sp. SYSU D00535]